MCSLSCISLSFLHQHTTTSAAKFKWIKSKEVGPTKKKKIARNGTKTLYGHRGICESCKEINF